jgi:hypothetical protein
MSVQIKRNAKDYMYAPKFVRANDGTRFDAPGFSGRAANARMASRVEQYERSRRAQADALALERLRGSNELAKQGLVGENKLDLQAMAGRQDKYKDMRSAKAAAKLAANTRDLKTLSGLQNLSSQNLAASIAEQGRQSVAELAERAAVNADTRSERNKNMDMLRDYTRAGQGLIVSKENPDNISLQNLGALRPATPNYRYKEGTPIMDDKGLPMLDEKGQPMYNPNQVIDLNSATTRNITQAQPKTFSQLSPMEKARMTPEELRLMEMEEIKARM